jgi:aryl-alcohol dehydrogenase-like predicted oxidoreductase
MRMVQLGRSGVSVTEFFFGAGGIGGIGSSVETRGKGLSLTQSLERLDEAYDLGIRVVDTANSYGGGLSEEAVGRWLGEREPEDVLVATKVGGRVEPGQDRIDLSGAHIARQLAASIRRLGRADLYLSNGPDPSTPLAETLTAFAAAVEGRTIRAYGFSNVTARQLEAVLSVADRERLPRPEWVQNSFSLLVRADERDLLPLAAAEEIGYTPYSPLAGGLLSDRYLGGAEPMPGSRIALAGAIYASVNTPGGLERVERLAALARDFDVSTAALALAWLRWHPHVTAPIVSPRRSSQWDAVHEALALDLSDGDAAGITELFD